MISIICALDERRAIGYQNQLLFHLRADLKRFRTLTSGHTVVMGRRTFESLPKGALPNRRNIVLSRSGFTAPGVEVFPSLEEAMRHSRADEKVFIIGGESVYRESMPIADRLLLTLIRAEAAHADTFFPDVDWDEWVLYSEETHEPDDENSASYSFCNYVRRP